MDDFKKAAQLALDAMKSHGSAFLGHEKKYAKAMTDLEQALKQKPVDEPVAWLTDREAMYFDKEDAWRDCDGFIQPLYTRPQPARDWVGLTDAEVLRLEVAPFMRLPDVYAVIWKALKEKNTWSQD